MISPSTLMMMNPSSRGVLVVRKERLGVVVSEVFFCAESRERASSLEELLSKSISARAAISIFGRRRSSPSVPRKPRTTTEKRCGITYSS